MMSGSLFAQMLPEGVPLNEETRKRYSPYHLADRNFPPTFLATGDADDVVAPSQSHRFAEKLRELGVEAHVAEAKGANHSWVSRLLLLADDAHLPALPLQDTTCTSATRGLPGPKSGGRIQSSPGWRSSSRS